MNVVLELQKLKEELVLEIDGKIEETIEKLRTDGQTVSERENVPVREL